MKRLLLLYPCSLEFPELLADAFRVEGVVAARGGVEPGQLCVIESLSPGRRLLVAGWERGLEPCLSRGAAVVAGGRL